MLAFFYVNYCLAIIELQDLVERSHFELAEALNL